MGRVGHALSVPARTAGGLDGSGLGRMRSGPYDFWATATSRVSRVKRLLGEAAEALDPPEAGLLEQAHELGRRVDPETVVSAPGDAVVPEQRMRRLDDPGHEVEATLLEEDGAIRQVLPVPLAQDPREPIAMHRVDDQRRVGPRAPAELAEHRQIPFARPSSRSS